MDIQASGTVIVLAIFIAAEAAAWYLFTCPSSSLAWYLNLGPFHIFERARGSTSAVRYLFTPGSLPIGIAALMIVALAWHLRVRFLVAFAANLSFAFAAAIIYAELPSCPTTAVDPMLFAISAFLNQDFAAALTIVLVASFISCITSHASFIAAIVSESKALSASHHNRGRPASTEATPQLIRSTAVL